MKRIQGKNVVGYVTVKVKGKRPEVFFQACTDAGIPVWDIKKQNNSVCLGKIYLIHVKRLKVLLQNYPYEVEIINRKGYINFFSYIWTRKELLLSILLCSAIIFFLSNIIWKVEINGVSVDIEDKLEKELASYGLYEGAWIYSLESLDIVQEQIVNDVPELLYIGIEKKGTTYTVDAVEKLVVKEESEPAPQHLIAAKNGIIQKMFIKKGSPVVNINDYVKKGDVLVSGVMEEAKNENEEESSEKLKEIVTSAEGEVFANTWYEVNVTSSLYQHTEKLSGDKITKYSLNIGKWQLPIWGFKKIPYEQVFEETEVIPVYLLKWKLPFNLIERTIYDKESFTQIRSEEDAKNIAIEHVKEDLKLKLGKDSEIIKYYVLHETVDNGKVKMNLYISVTENIAIGKQIK
ncbi:sporulation protein YqfD [Pseudogracilibacillus sp. SO30301A]|uniref:sporulation protein YqfD n=1 Tax=Pseudogracilibacillus sp. SO30301A TaxID=3098291 RepID=UPI00300E0B84